jgi:hypothetical protein
MMGYIAEISMRRSAFFILATEEDQFLESLLLDFLEFSKKQKQSRHLVFCHLLTNGHSLL